MINRIALILSSIIFLLVLALVRSSCEAVLSMIWVCSKMVYDCLGFGVTPPFVDVTTHVVAHVISSCFQVVCILTAVYILAGGLGMDAL